VSSVLEWAEVARIKDPEGLNIKTFVKRLTKKDPWAKFVSRKQSLQSAAKVFFARANSLHC